MTRASRSRRSSPRTRCARTTVALLLAVAAPAQADEAPSPQIVVPGECLPFLSIPGGPASPVAWDAMLSFAACIQDGSVARVDRADQLEAFVEQLQVGLDPSLQLYEAAIAEAPGPVKLRAAYYVGLGQVALMTRARASLASPGLRRQLESLLEPHAKLAYFAFSTIDRADRDLTPDVVTRYMVRSAHELAAALRRTWSFPTAEGLPLLALPR